MMYLSPSTIQAVEMFRASAQRHYFVFAFATFIFSVVAFLFLSVGVLIMATPLTEYLTASAWLFGASGFVIVCMLLLGFRRGHLIMAGFWAQFHAWENAARDAKYPENPVTPLTPSGLPALPVPEIETVKVNVPNRGGEDVPKQLVRGFDMRDVEFLCRLLANGFKFTEAAMEKVILPHSLEVMGKAQENTAYTRFMEWCVEAKVIVGREAKKAGTLAIVEYPDILRALKEHK